MKATWFWIIWTTSTKQLVKLLYCFLLFCFGSSLSFAQHTTTDFLEKPEDHWAFFTNIPLIALTSPSSPIGIFHLRVAPNMARHAPKKGFLTFTTSEANVRTRELDETNNQLRTKNKELETMDGIVKAINRELALNQVLETILTQGMAMCRHANKAYFLLHDTSENHYACVAMVGYNQPPHEPLAEAALRERYLTHSIELETGVNFIGEEQEVSETDEPAGRLYMSIIHDRTLQGLMVFAHGEAREAFDAVRLETLARFREHASSAIARARLLMELRQKNSEILETQRQLVLQEKMATLGTMVAGIAHELKNPLNFINNFSEIAQGLTEELRESLILHREKVDPDVVEYIRSILDDLDENTRLINGHGRKADQVIHKMMDLSGTGTGTPRPTNLNTLIDEFAELAHHRLLARDQVIQVAMEKRFDPNLNEVALMAPGLGTTGLNRVIINLVNNALEAVVAKKQAFPQDYAPRVLIKTHRRGQMVEILIEDNGDGIEPDEIDRIFTPFYTTKPAGSGHIGLGLSVCYDMVTRSKGQIEVCSDMGRTCFTVCLPLQAVGA